MRLAHRAEQVFSFVFGHILWIVGEHCWGVQVGNFYLADKAGGQAFTREDEEVLAPFAAQAGAAIANAREHRDEQRARADLEVLIETSPVGVVVFDARSGQVVRS